MSALKWRFPSNNGGQDDGLNDAGIETFNSRDDQLIVREAIQNILDAKRDDADYARAVFDVWEMATTDVPDIEGLRQTMELCLSDWESNQSAKVFFNKAKESVSNQTLRVLKISDYGTKGVTGDEESKDSDWYNLVKSRGSSFKEGTAGGSFGIGKNAPFATSKIRTVFYSTLTESGDYAFQGVAKLVTHTVNGDKTQGTGFYGLAEGNRAIRNREEIPTIFRRSETGTDLYVLCYSGSKNWSGNFKEAVLENFWPAIERGLLKVKVGKDLIQQNNLESEIRKMRKREPSFEALPYYEADQDPDQEFTENIEHLGEVELRLKVSEGYPRRIEMIRNTGMVIYKKAHFRTRQPFAGVFRCKDEKGNELLRAMEPPSHNTWDYKRLHDDQLYDVAKSAYNQLTGWLHKMVKCLEPEPTGEALDVEDVANYLPDEEDREDDDLSYKAGGQSTPNETLEEDNSPTPVTVRRRQVTPMGQPSDSSEARGEVEGDDQGGNDEGGSQGTTNGDGRNTGGQHQSGGDDAGSSSGNECIQRKVKYRTFLSNANDNTYRVIIEPDATFKGRLNVKAVGEEGSPQAIAIDRAVDLRQGGVLSVSENGWITGLAFYKGVRMKLEVTVHPHERLALAVSAHEDN